ncbi:MAG: VWA domain-containing protein, partial [Kofleriaceae bacterium]
MKSLLSPGALIRLAVSIAAVVAIWFLISEWIGDRTSVTVDVTTRPIDLLSPQWLHLIAVVPAFFVLRVLSLTDLSLAQQVVQATLRSLVIAGLAIALSRPSWITETSKVSTIVLVDVSDSVSDKQLAAARHYIDDIQKDQGDGNFQVISFAEKPTVIREKDGKYDVQRHVNAGAGTDTQAAMQLAYGLFPQGYLPRIVMISDGNQTEGDVAVEAYRAKDLGVKVSWKNFEADATAEVRVVGVTTPDDIKVGQPYEVTAEVWSTEAQSVTLALQQDEFPNGREPIKTVELREGKNLVKFTSEAKRAGYTTYKLALTKVAHDTEKQNNTAVMTAPVKGRPSILYVEGGVLREPNSASYLKKALEHENIDVEVRGPTGIPSNAKELEKYDLVLVSDVPAHLMGAGQMAALDTYVKGMGGGLIMAGGEDSFGSGGYERTMIENMMPVR